ncbi:MAG: AzlD domain-containing protein [Alphaproteobacteria bacterium]|nr:AzlD domain-containing protein [Alphaproteobacteria bacterium]
MSDIAIYGTLIAGAAATYVWRAGGIALARRIDPESPAMGWFACVAYALVAALVARMILLPGGPLATTGLVARVAATGVAVTILLATRGNALGGVLGGAGALWLAMSLGL